MRDVICDNAMCVDSLGERISFLLPWDIFLPVTFLVKWLDCTAAIGRDDAQEVLATTFQRQPGKRHFVLGNMSNDV